MALTFRLRGLGLVKGGQAQIIGLFLRGGGNKVRKDALYLYSEEKKDKDICSHCLWVVTIYKVQLRFTRAHFKGPRDFMP